MPCVEAFAFIMFHFSFIQGFQFSLVYIYIIKTDFTLHINI